MRSVLCGLFASAALLLASMMVRADLLTATVAYQQEQFDKARQEFMQLARLGNVDALYNLGVMNLHGQGQDKDYAKAFAWFSIAADFGLSEAGSAASLVYQQLPEQTQLTELKQQLDNEFGYLSYQHNLQPVFMPHSEQQDLLAPQRSHFLEPVYPEEAYKKGLEGWVWVEFDIDPSGAVKDLEIIDGYPPREFERSIYNAVSRWRYQPLLKEGQPQPYHSRSLLYHFSTHKGRRYRESFSRQSNAYQQRISELIERAEQGDALVQYYISNWLMTEQSNAAMLLRRHYQQDYAAGEVLLEAAKNGYALAQYRLGSSLLRGQLAESDRHKGLNWVLQAAQSGLAVAQYRLAREILDSKDVQQEWQKAARWLAQAAEQGHFRAIRDLAELNLQQGLLNDVEPLLQQGLALDDQHPQLLFIQARLLTLQGQGKAAKGIGEQALKQAENREWYRQDIQNWLTQTGN
ncbi:TonB family protein [Bowmanella sp. Y26]|uniref:TonB family protein n=1 Tax=Bowmanella yangjiangensis TaxID=2811230 RepID=UPI001BDBEEF4|nr:TonB family protein [Bowmanella yangjiangensis]MBT1062764.1 TonB family protein [Bowmanella yangjiangensis]